MADILDEHMGSEDLLVITYFKKVVGLLVRFQFQFHVEGFFVL